MLTLTETSHKSRDCYPER